MPSIGFANLSEQSPFSIQVREGLEAAAAQHPELELLIRDNDLDDHKALQNAHEFKAAGVDLAIIYHINQHIQSDIFAALLPIPIICVDIPINLTNYFGVNNAQVGTLLGQQVADFVTANWDGQIDKTLAIVDSRVSEMVSRRTTGIIDTLQQARLIDEDNLLAVDGRSERDTVIALIEPILQRWQDYHRIVGIGYNSDTCLALIDVIRKHQRLNDFVVVAQGADEQMLQELDDPSSPLIAVTNFHPERYGEQLVELALRRLAGEHLPQYSYVQSDVLTRQHPLGTGG